MFGSALILAGWLVAYAGHRLGTNLGSTRANVAARKRIRMGQQISVRRWRHSFGNWCLERSDSRFRHAVKVRSDTSKASDFALPTQEALWPSLAPGFRRTSPSNGYGLSFSPTI